MTAKKSLNSKKKSSLGKLPKAAPVSEHVSDSSRDSFRSTVKLPAANDAWPGAFTALWRSSLGVWRNLVPLLVIVVAYCLATYVQPASDISFADLMIFTYSQTLLCVVLLASLLPVYSLAIADGKDLPIGAWLAASVRRYMISLIVTTLVLMIFILSSFLLFVPLLWVGPWISLAPFVAVDPRRDDTGVMAAFRESYRLTRYRKLHVWSIIGAMFLLTFLLTMIFSIVTYYVRSPAIAIVLKALSCAVAVLASCALAMLYRWLQRDVPAEA